MYVIDEQQWLASLYLFVWYVDVCMKTVHGRAARGALTWRPWDCLPLLRQDQPDYGYEINEK
jgi:hypothetical protein